MSSFKNEIVSFSQFCKEQQFFISIDKLQTYFGYIESKKIQSFEEKIRYLFFLIPKDKDEKDKLKHLISEYFNFKFEESTSFEFNFFDESFASRQTGHTKPTMTTATRKYVDSQDDMFVLGAWRFMLISAWLYAA